MIHYMNTILIMILFVTYMISARKHKLRIYQGDDVENYEYKYVVTLILYEEKPPSFMRVCTGTLLSAQWVLTAGHCLEKAVKYVLYGNITVSPSQTEFKSLVRKKVIHERYFIRTLSNDIGMLLIQPITTISRYASISAIDYKSLLGLPVIFVGSGVTYLQFNQQHYRNDSRRVLQKGKGVIVSCSGDRMPKHLICVAAVGLPKQYTLAGDSGGPLLFDNKIIAITCSGLVDHGEHGFTPVSPFITWITNVMTSKEHNEI